MACSPRLSSDQELLSDDNPDRGIGGTHKYPTLPVSVGARHLVRTHSLGFCGGMPWCWTCGGWTSGSRGQSKRNDASGPPRDVIWQMSMNQPPRPRVWLQLEALPPPLITLALNLHNGRFRPQVAIKRSDQRYPSCLESLRHMWVAVVRWVYIEACQSQRKFTCKVCLINLRLLKVRQHTLNF